MNKVSRKDIAKVAVEMMNKGASSRKVAKELAAYLLSERRTSELAPLMRDIADLRAQNGLVEVDTASAYKLESSVETAIKKLAAQHNSSARKFILNHEQDPQLVGGVVYRSGDYELDLTIRGKLNKLKLTRSQS